jgi:hypothetical protein
VFLKTKQSQEESLQGHIDLDDQLKKGKKVASTIRVEQPYLKSNKEYDPFGRKHVVERIIEKIRQNIKLGQYKLGDSILIVDLGHLMMPLISIHVKVEFFGMSPSVNRGCKFSNQTKVTDRI